jgi:hypothetical protein
VGNSLGSDDQALRNRGTNSIRRNESPDAGRPDAANATYATYATDSANASYPTNAADAANAA